MKQQMIGREAVVEGLLAAATWTGRAEADDVVEQAIAAEHVI